MNKVKILLKDYQPRHSEFQIDNFIVGSQGDAWAMYKQALAEIDARVKDLVEQKEALEIHLLTRPGVFAITKRRRRIKQIKLTQWKRRAINVKKGMAETRRELRRFVKLAWRLRADFNSLDPKAKQVLEAESWLNKARQLAFVDSLCYGGQPSQRTVEFILSLPQDLQQVVLAELSAKEIKALRGATP